MAQASAESEAEAETEAVFFRCLRSAVAAGLVVANGPASDWYAFRSPTIGAALRGRLTAPQRAALAERAARAVGELHPGLPGRWCLFTAGLRRGADDRPGAARLFGEAGVRALTAGRAGAAVGLLTEAWELLDGCDDLGLRAEILAGLMAALTADGRTGRGLRLAATLDEVGGPGVDAGRAAVLHVRLARLHHAEGQRSEGLAQVDAALSVLGPDAADRHTAAVDAVHALLLAPQSPERAVRLAARATERGDSSGVPAVACEAWRVRGVLALRRGSVSEAARCFDRVAELAERHGLPEWRLRAMAHRAARRWLADGDRAGLVRARRHARQLGATAVATEADLLLSLDQVLRGEYAAAGSPDDVGLDGGGTEFRTAVRAIRAWHRGRRERSALAPQWAALGRGLGEAVGALLAEDRDRARALLAEAAVEDAARPAPYPLVGQFGLALLLDVLAERADWSRLREVAAAEASGLRWNRHFLLLAEAVLLGRAGRGAEAADTRARASALGEPYPPAAQLGLRLVAEAACADRWGEPVPWLRGAEEHFHRTGAGAVARACRALLRRAGAVVPHRAPAGRVPARLRLLGVTEREYEVLLLMADRPDNRALAQRLFISPRTVEKHVASLVLKTGVPGRAALHTYAADIDGDEGRPPVSRRPS